MSHNGHFSPDTDKSADVSLRKTENHNPTPFLTNRTEPKVASEPDERSPLIRPAAASNYSSMRSNKGSSAAASSSSHSSHAAAQSSGAAGAAGSDMPDAGFDYIWIAGYSTVWWKTTLYYLGVLLTGGILFLVSFWIPWVSTVCRKSRRSLQSCDSVLVRGIDQTWEELDVEEHGAIRLFIFRNIQYVYNADSGQFVKPLLNVSLPFAQLHAQLAGGISSAAQYEERHTLYGRNAIAVPVPSWFTLLLNETLHPFYLFQVGSCILWFLTDYYYYASTIMVMSTVSVGWTVFFTRKNLQNLSEMAKSECVVTVRRAGALQQIHSVELVPGDLMRVDPDQAMPCDLVVVAGEAVVNEAMLTGESNAVLKFPLPLTQDIYNPVVHKKHTLFCGTRTIQAKAGPGQDAVYGVVTRTGFSTAKGQLFNTILFPKPIKFKFYNESYKFLALMVLVALVATGLSWWVLNRKGFPFSEVLAESVDLLTITVPPALPLVLTIGIGFAMDRLKEDRIYCIAPQRINFAGKINSMCFDKTGTLTHDDLSLEGIQPASDVGFADIERDVVEWQSATRRGHPLLHVLTTTHSISKLNGENMGHPVDVRMFEATSWEFHAPGDSHDFVHPPETPEAKLLIHRRFEFQPSLQRMSVIISRTDQPQLIVCCKGSPEAVRSLCRPETVPKDFADLLRAYAKRGYYVLGCAHRFVDMPLSEIQSAHREDLEHDMIFSGLLILENRLKPDTAGVVRELQRAEIDVLMITGDNVYTAITVARNCSIFNPNRRVLLGDTSADTGELEWIDADSLEAVADPLQILAHEPAEVAITGKAINFLFAANRTEVIPYVKVFARTSPDQKQLICEYLIQRGRYVGMCGDGTNDCGALKAAHCGLALSDAEASVVSPFTSAKKTISDVVTLFTEGRCALQTSLGAFKFMVLYPVIQTCQTLRLYWSYTTLGDFQFLYVDLVLVLPLAVTMCFSGAFPQLSRRAPHSSLFNFRILTSLLLQVLFVVAALLLVSHDVTQQPWYVQPYTSPDEDITEDVVSLINSVMFLFGNFCYIVVAIAFTNALPFRKPLYTNYLFVLSMLGAWGLSSVLLLLPWMPGWLNSLLEIDESLPLGYRFRLWFAAWLLLALCWSLEQFITEGVVGDTFMEWWQSRKRTRRNREKKWRDLSTVRLLEGDIPPQQMERQQLHRPRRELNSKSVVREPNLDA